MMFSLFSHARSLALTQVRNVHQEKIIFLFADFANFA